MKRNKLIEENERLRKANLRLTEEVHVIIELTKVSALKLQTTQRSNAHKKSMAHSTAALRSSEQTLRQTIVHLKEHNEHLQWELKEKAKKSLELSHEIDRCKYLHKQAAKEAKEKYVQEKRHWEEDKAKLHRELLEHQRKHEEEFFALYSDYKECRKELAMLKHSLYTKEERGEEQMYEEEGQAMYEEEGEQIYGEEGQVIYEEEEELTYDEEGELMYPEEEGEQIYSEEGEDF